MLREIYFQVRYLKIIEKSGYQALPWVRYITQNGDYQLRTQWTRTGITISEHSAPNPPQRRFSQSGVHQTRVLFRGPKKFNGRQLFNYSETLLICSTVRCSVHRTSQQIGNQLEQSCHIINRSMWLNRQQYMPFSSENREVNPYKKSCCFCKLF